MQVRNFLKANLEDLHNCHDGTGVLKNIVLFNENDFLTGIRFINYTILPPGTSIGIHKHGNDEEIYIILEGSGVMTVDSEEKTVTSGDIVVNRPFGSHGLFNNSEKDLKILVFEVAGI
jgi:mannose-6-phosphate isomerase-like protein (cupin superfamily)